MTVWLLLAACSGSDKDPPPPPVGDDDDTPDSGLTEDTAPEGGTLEATYWGLTAVFAVDGVTQSAVSYGERSGGVHPISFTVTLLTPDALYVGVNEQTSCSATFDIEGTLPPAPWAAEVGAWVAFDLPLDGEVRDQCAFYALPAEYQGELASHVRNWSWAMGLGPLDVETEKALRNTLDPSEWDGLAPYIVGGGVRSDVFGSTTAGPAWFGLGYGVGYEVDAGFVLAENALGDPLPLPSSTVWSGTSLATGYYEVQVGVFDQPGALTYASYAARRLPVAQRGRP